MFTALLSHEESIELLKKVKEGDEDAKNEMVVRNMGLVKSIVTKFLGRGVEYDDLLQIGSLGLLRAIINFDPTYDVKFSTYAVPMIMGEIKRFLRDDGSLKVSRSLKECAMEVYAANERLKVKLMRDPTVAELAQETGKTPEEIAGATDAMRKPISLNELVHDDSKTQFIDLLYSDDGEKSLDNIMLKDLLNKLNKKERELLTMRFSLDKTQNEIAKMMGVSQVQVSRLISRIIEKLRRVASE